MSLLVCAVFEGCAVIAADSKAVKIEDGRVVPIGDHYCKFWTLGEGTIAVGSTGSLLMNRMLYRFSHEVAERYRENPEGLFVALEQAIPDFVRILNPVVERYIDDTHRDLGESVPFLCGYDNSQKQIRAIYWKHLTPENCMGGVVGIGYPEATELVTQLISDELGETFTPGSVAKTMKNAIHTAAKDSEYVGGAIRTHVIMTPEFKQNLRRFNEMVAS